MTRKRYYLEDYKDFTVITLRLYDNEIEYKHYEWLTDCNKIVDLLNKYDENCKMYREDALKAEKEKEQLLEENKQLNQDRTRLLNFLRRELEYDVGDEIYDILHNKFYDKVWWDEENEKITSEYIKKDHEEWIKPR